MMWWSDGGERVEERTDAQYHQRGVDDLAGGAVGLGEAADGGGGVERPAKGVPEADVLAERKAERAEQQQADDDRAQQRDAPHEHGQLPMRGGVGAVGRAAQQAIEL
jgi:hypothetical protein